MPCLAGNLLTNSARDFQFLSLVFPFCQVMLLWIDGLHAWLGQMIKPPPPPPRTPPPPLGRVGRAGPAKGDHLMSVFRVKLGDNLALTIFYGDSRQGRVGGNKNNQVIMYKIIFLFFFNVEFQLESFWIKKIPRCFRFFLSLSTVNLVLIFITLMEKWAEKQ